MHTIGSWMQSASGRKNKRAGKKLSWNGGRLDYSRLLTQQSFGAKFVVLYNTSGTNISAAYLTPAETEKMA